MIAHTKPPHSASHRASTAACRLLALGRVGCCVGLLLAGQKVATLVEGTREAGTYTIRWDGRDAQGRALASGVYLYRLRAGEGQVETRKLVLVR